MTTSPDKSAAAPGSDRWWSLDAAAVCDRFDVEPESGLTAPMAQDRRHEFGDNSLGGEDGKSAWSILLDQAKSLVVILLAVAAILAVAVGQVIEGAAIGVALVLNAAIGFFTELRAVKSVEALRRMGRMQARVLRASEEQSIDAAHLAPGDIVLLEAGDVAPADLRLVRVENLEIDEASLTGESAPVAKSADAANADAPLAERTSMAYRGTHVTRGAGRGVVVATGEATQLGAIARQVAEAEESATPLEARIDRLGRRLIVLALLVGVLVAGAGALAGKDLLVMAETAIALAIAAVPEGLPIAATLALAAGVRRMAKRNALVKRLSAVETLGATTVVLTDKTGTLTENRMSLEKAALAQGDINVVRDAGATRFEESGEAINVGECDALQRFLEVGVLCSNAELPGEGEEDADGDPLEIALLEAGAASGFRRAELLERYREAREESFDADVKMMATFHETDDGFRVAVKGAPEAVLEASERVLYNGGSRAFGAERRAAWLDRNDALAGEGLRLIALAEKSAGDIDADPYKDLTLLGLAGLLDPPRADARDAIEAFAEAGVAVVMVTGDQKETARNIACAVGLSDADDEVVEGVRIDALLEAGEAVDRRVFARVTPEQKLKLITAFQETGEIVGMTGDGVNDAPALKKADIGVAMGDRGTEVAREASDIVLLDDSLSTVAAAIGYGRAIFNNIRRFIIYLLSGNLGEILAVAAAALVAAPLPLLALQILFINLVLDVFPALALGVSRGGPELMARAPRDPEEAILTKAHWRGVLAFGALIAASVLAAFAMAFHWLGADEEEAVSIAFICFGFSRLWHVFNMRSPQEPVFRNDVTANPYVWGAIAVCLALLGAAVFAPVLSDVLELEAPSPEGWLLAIGWSAAPLLAGQVGLAVLAARGDGKTQAAPGPLRARREGRA